MPDASIAAFALASANRAFVEPFVKELRRRDKVSLFTSIAYHHYSMNPDLGYEQFADEITFRAVYKDGSENSYTVLLTFDENGTLTASMA